MTRKITRENKEQDFRNFGRHQRLSPKPKAAAIREIMRNINDHFSIVSPQIAMFVRDR